MNMDDYSNFEEIMSRAALVTNRHGKDWDAMITVMFEELATYKLDDIAAAVGAHVRSEKFFPTLADIVTQLEGDVEDRAALAWAKVVRAVEHLGGGISIRFPSPAIHYAIEQMGGWQKLCATLTNDSMVWREKEFSRFYAIGEKTASWEPGNGRVQVPRYLCGQYEINNRQNHYKLPAVYDSETEQPIEGIRAELSEPGRKTNSVVIRVTKGMQA
jgi:hypothetical protein